MAIVFSQGVYTGVVKEAVLTESSTGTPTVAVKFTVTHFGDGEKEAVPRELDRTAYHYITEKSVEFTAKALRSLGYEGDNFRGLEEPGCLVGVDGLFYCKHEVYNGEEKEKWSIASGGGESEIKPLDQAKARKLDALFGKALASAPKRVGTPPAPSRASVPKSTPPETGDWQPTDDSVPF